MLATIDLYHQSRFHGRKVRNVSDDWHLSTEFQAADLSVTKARPEHPLGVC
jgi:hypothetical protein